MYSVETDGYPTLAFEDAERTIMVAFTDIGKARLAALDEWVDRPVAQLNAAVGD